MPCFAVIAEVGYLGICGSLDAERLDFSGKPIFPDFEAA
jgi:hypothetical protein